MLTNEQCIEIAEKGWKYKRYSAHDLWINDCKNLIGIEQLQKEVNSWQGFGKTVEAMADLGWYFDGGQGDDDPILTFRHHRKGIIELKYYPFEMIDVYRKTPIPKKLITATHLAALEDFK